MLVRRLRHTITRTRHRSSAAAEIASAIHTVRCGVHSSVTLKLLVAGVTSQPFA